MPTSRWLALACGAGVLAGLSEYPTALLAVGTHGEIAQLGALLPLVPLIGLAAVVAWHAPAAGWFLRTFAATSLASVIALPFVAPMVRAAGRTLAGRHNGDFTLVVPRASAYLGIKLGVTVVLCLVISGAVGLLVRGFLRFRAA